MPIYFLLQEGSKRSLVIEVHTDTSEKEYLLIENEYLEYFIGGHNHVK